MKQWNTIKSNFVINEEYCKVRQDTVELPNGKILDDYYLWIKDDVSLIIPVTPENEFLLVKQYKHGAGKIVVEFPAGFINTNELPMEAAKRELSEETGFQSSNMKLLSTLTNDATKETSKIFLFLAPDAVKVNDVKLDATEEIQILLKTPTEILNMVNSGEIWVSASVIGVFLALQELGVISVKNLK